MRSGNQKSFTLGDFVEQFGGELIGAANTEINQVSSLERAKSDQISFFSGARYRNQLQHTAAGAIILALKDRDATTLPRIVCSNPYAYFAKVSALLNPAVKGEPGVHSLAEVDASAQIAVTASIGPFVYIGKNARIGENAVISPGCYIGDDVEIGSDSKLYPRVVIYHDCLIGSRVILHSGVVVGADGFGLANEEGRWLKIPQIGRVIIGDDVEIGANTTVDRGALEDTIIEEGVKLDNLIMVAHNVKIGAHSAMAGCVGIAGSATIGSHCTVGGAGMVLGHLELADGVNVSAGTLITKSITKPGTYTSAMPFSSHKDWLKNAAQLRHLDNMAVKIRMLEQKINELERKSS